MNKKIILSLLVVLLLAVSVSAVAAEDVDDAVALDDDVITEDIKETAVLQDGETADAAAIQTAIDNANEGDTIELDANRVYEVGNATFNMTKQLTIKGSNTTVTASGAAQGGSGALFIANVAGTGFEGISFINTDGHKAYGEAVSGYAIQLAIANGTVNNCKFIDWNSGIYGRGASYCTITDSYFTGSAELVTGAGKGEQGTKAINLMGSHHITVTGCTFEGQVLDGISIASNGGYNIMTNNTFIDNVYAIYFGGASTQGCVISNNRFIRCGYCPDVSPAVNKKITVLSTQKACNGFIISDNYIEALEGTTFIMAESGNTAHGYPSSIGDINITGNTLIAAEGADAATIRFIYIVSNAGALNPYAPIAITGNTIDAGINAVSVWYADWGASDGVTTVIPAADPVKTYINVKDISTADGKLTIELDDVNGDGQGGEALSYTINGGEETNITTDADGIATITANEDGIIAIFYAGSDKLAASSATINFTSTAAKADTEIDVADITTNTITSKYLTLTLKDKAGNVLVNKTISYTINGAVKTATTDENGQVKIKTAYTTAGTRYYTFTFLGDDDYSASVATAKVTVSKSALSKTTFAKQTFKVKATKKVKVTFKDAKGNALKSKKVTLTVNGKTYTATTNSKGLATFTVKLTAKKTYSATAKYAGDSTYLAKTIKSSIVVK